MELPVRNIKGELVSNLTVSDALFGVPMNRTVVHQAMVAYRANRRQGTSNTKTRGEVSGGGRKPWAQKGTGRARQGSIRAPQWRHGGVSFGPHPRDYRQALPRRIRHLALKCVLSEKVRGNRLIVLDELAPDAPSTKVMIEILASLGANTSTLILTEGAQRSVVLSARNLEKVWTLPVPLLNAEELLKRDLVIMTVSAARKAEALWAEERAGLRRRPSSLVEATDGVEAAASPPAQAQEDA